MAEDKNPRRAEKKLESGLYSFKLSESLRGLLASDSDELNEAWVTPFKKTDKHVQRSDKRNAKSIEEAELERLTQSNKLRGPFMYTALAMVFTIIVISSIVVVALTFRGELETTMGVAFSVTLGIEVVGILAIIAHYLFSVPESYLLEKVKRAKEAEDSKDGREIEDDE